MTRMRPRRTEQGQTLPLVALCLVGLFVAAALSVDIGSLAATNRRLQSVADLAAIDGSRALNGMTCADIYLLPTDEPQVASTQYDHVVKAVTASAERNGFEPGGTKTLSVELGFMTPEADGTSTFTPLPNLCTVVPGAVRVRAGDKTRFSFATVIGQDGRTTGRSGVAASSSALCPPPEICIQSDGSPFGTVRIGSTLASASTSVGPTEVKILNRLISPLIGGTVNLDAGGWKGLADANVTFARLRAALGLTAGSTDQVLDTTVTYRQLLDATASALNADGSPSSVAAATTVASVASQVSSSLGLDVTLRDVFQVNGATGSGTDVADATLNVLDIVRGGAYVADTNNFTSFNLSASDVSAIPGFNGATVKVGLIEGPQQESGPPRDAAGYDTVAETSQLRVQVEVDLLVQVTGLGLTAVKVPYYLDVGTARAYLESLSCSGSDSLPSSVTIKAMTEAGTFQLGKASDTSLGASTDPVPTTARLVDVAGLVTVDTKSVATVVVPGNSGTMLTFTPDYATAPSQRVGSTSVGLPTAAVSNLTVTALVLGLNATAIATDVSTGINNALPGIQSKIVDQLYRSLGVSYAGADVWAPPAQTCSPTSFAVDPAAPERSFPALVG